MIHTAYKSDEELCKWLRACETVVGSKCGYAAERIETLNIHLANVQIEGELLESRIKELESKLAEKQK